MNSVLGPLVYFVVTVCDPGKPCVTEHSKPIPLLECEARKELLLSGADGKEPLRYDTRVRIECKEVRPDGR